jgi:hypothetical protein
MSRIRHADDLKTANLRRNLSRQKRLLKLLCQSSNLIKSLRVSVTFAVMPAGAPL